MIDLQPAQPTRSGVRSNSLLATPANHFNKQRCAALRASPLQPALFTQ
jgi:hypothetical protein